MPLVGTKEPPKAVFYSDSSSDLPREIKSVLTEVAAALDAGAKPAKKGPENGKHGT